MRLTVNKITVDISNNCLTENKKINKHEDLLNFIEQKKIIRNRIEQS